MLILSIAFSEFHGRFLGKRQEDIPPLLRLRHRADGGYPAARGKAPSKSSYDISENAIN
jgi:hypothetical protein